MSAKKNPRKTLAGIILDSGLDICTKTATKILNAVGIRSFVAFRKAVLNSRNAKRRLEWAKQFRLLDAGDWARWVFSDECSVELFGVSRKTRFWITKQDRFKPRFVQGRFQKGGGSLLIWGAISVHGPGPLLFIEGSINGETYAEIVQQTIAPYLFQLLGDHDHVFKFADDNAPPHRSHKAQKAFERFNIQRVWWPASSPDLNPIENLWAAIKDRLARYQRLPRNFGELRSRIEEIWRQITPEECQKLITSMTGRMQEVIKNRGWYTSK
jgi:hypothetical protein